MPLPFTIGAVAELYVQDYDGFDRPPHVSVVSTLSDGIASGNQVLQSGSVPLRQATATGTLYNESDVILLRGYQESSEAVAFRDGDGREYTVRVLEFSARAFTGRWSFGMSLVAEEG
jgi:hypothetical protein